MKSETINALLKEPLSNMCQAFLDQYVEENVNQRHQMGVHTVIIRQMLGNCCDWCRDLAGVYNDGEIPPNIYHRHDHCKCVVTYKTSSGGYQNAHSKKKYKSYGESRRDGLKIIDNVENDTSNRIGNLKRLEEIAKRDVAVEKLYRIASDKGKKYADVTKAYRDNKISGDIAFNEMFNYKSKKFKLNGVEYYADADNIERAVAEVIVNELGGQVTVKPRITTPSNRHVPDYSINGIDFELKSPTKSRYKTVHDLVKRGENQSENIVLNLDETDATYEEIDRIIERMFSDKELEWINQLIVIRNKRIYKFLKRI